MSFGSVQYKPSKANPRRIVASYPTPIEAYAKLEGLPKRISKTFPVDAEADARRWLIKQQQLIELDLWEPPTEVEHAQAVSQITLNDYWEEWITTRRTASGKLLAEQTRYRMTCDYNNHIRPYLGKRILATITDDDITKWFNTLPEDQPSTRINSVKVLGAILRSAARSTGTTPPILRHMPTMPTVARNKTKHNVEPATPEQVKAIYDAMPERCRLAIYLAVFCRGLRIGEVCALQVGHIDLNHNILHVTQSRQYMGNSVIGPTKTEGSERDERIPDVLIPIIQSHIDNLPAADPDDWLFPAATNAAIPIHPNSLRTQFSQARKAAGREDLHFHDLRHTALTWLAQDGATLRELMDSAGHTTTGNALRYQHRASQREQELTDKLGARLLMDDERSIRARIAQLDAQIAVLEQERADLQRKLENK